MILASVLALFYRAAIGSQKELKIMTVGKTPPPSQARYVRLRLPTSMGLFSVDIFATIFLRPWSGQFCVPPPSAEPK